MGKKKAAAKQAKKPSELKASKPKLAKTKAPRGKPRSTASRSTPPARKDKAAKATESKASQRSAAKPLTVLAFDSERYGKLKAVLCQLIGEDLHNLWLSVYGYGDEVTDEHVPEDRDRLITELADTAYELNPTPEQMTPKGLGDLLNAF
jgi:hypothetical protein